MAGLRDVAQIRQGLDVFHLECEEEVRMVLLVVRAIQRRSPISRKEAAVYCCCC